MNPPTYWFIDEALPGILSSEEMKAVGKLEQGLNQLDMFLLELWKCLSLEL